MLTETLGRHETLNVFFTQPGASLHFPNLNDVVQASGPHAPQTTHLVHTDYICMSYMLFSNSLLDGCLS